MVFRFFPLLFDFKVTHGPDFFELILNTRISSYKFYLSGPTVGNLESVSAAWSLIVVCCMISSSNYNRHNGPLVSLLDASDIVSRHLKASRSVLGVIQLPSTYGRRSSTAHITARQSLRVVNRFSHNL